MLAGARGGRAASTELRGILVTLAAMLLFGLMDAGSKFLSTRYPVPQILWLRYVFTVPLLLLVLAPGGWPAGCARPGPGSQVGTRSCSSWRSGSWSGASGSCRWPTFTPSWRSPPRGHGAVGAALGEQVGRAAGPRSASASLGVLVILQPRLGVVHPRPLVALVSVLLYALYQVLTRMVGRVDAAETSLLWQLVVGSLALSFIVPFAWRTPAVPHWPLFVVVAALGGLGHYCMIKALQLAPGRRPAVQLRAALGGGDRLRRLRRPARPWTLLGAA